MAGVAWALAAWLAAEFTAESADRRETRLLDIRHLTEPISDHPLEGPRSIGRLVVRSEYEETYLGGYEPKEDRAEPSHPPLEISSVTPEALVDLIRRSIAQETWEDPRNAIEARSDTLAVRQTPDVLEAIQGLLARLSAQRMGMASVDIAIVPLDAIDDVVRAGSPWLSSETFDRILERAGDRGRRIALTGYDGQLISAHSGTRRAVIQDYDVNDVGVLPVLNPKVETIPFGTLAEVRPRVIPDTRWLILEFHVVERSLAGDAEKQEAPFGEFESIPIAEKSLRGTTLVRAREAVLLGFLHGEDAAIGSFAGIARVRPPSVRDERPDGARLTRWFRELDGLVSIETWTLKGARAAVHAFAASAGPGGELPGDWPALAKRLGLVPDTSARTIGLAGEKSEAHAWITKTYGAGHCFHNAGELGWLPGRVTHRFTEWAGSGFDLGTRAHIPAPALASFRLAATRADTRFENTATLRVPWPTPSWRDPLSHHEPEKIHQIVLGEDTIPVPVTIDLPSQALWSIDREIAVPTDVPILLAVRSDGPLDSPGRITMIRATPWRWVDPGPAEHEKRTFDLSLFTSSPHARGGLSTGPPGRLELRSHEEGELPQDELWNPHPQPKSTAVLAGMEDRETFNISPEFVVDVLRSTIAPATWEDGRNALTLEGEKLTVIHSPEIVREVDGMLGALREVVLRRFDIEIAFVPRESFERTAGRAAQAGPWFPSTTFDKAVEAAGDSAILWRANAADGEELRIEPVVRRTALADHEMGPFASPPPTPVVRILGEGLGGRLRAWSTPHPGCADLEFEIASLDIGRPSERRSAPLGDIDLSERCGVFLSGAIPVPAGKAALLGDLRLPGREPRSRVVLARVRSSAPSPPPHPLVRPFDVRVLLRRWPVTRVAKPEKGCGGGSFSFCPEQDPARRWDMDVLFDLVGSMLPPELSDEATVEIKRSSTHLFVTAAGDAALTARAGDAVERILRPLYEREATTVDFRLRLETIGAGDLSKIKDPQADGPLLVENWREVASIERERSIRLAGLAGWPVGLWAAHGRDYVADLEKISGGFSAGPVAASYPVIGWSGSGIEFRASVEPIPGLRDLAIWVKGVSAETTFGKTLDVRADETVERAEPAGFRPVGMKVAIDLPEQEVQSWEHEVAVPAGRAALLRAFPDPREPAKLRILVVEARAHDLPAE